MRWLALIFKTLAIIFWLGVSWVFVQLDLSDLLSPTRPTHRDTPEDWGTSAYYFEGYTRVALTIIILCLSMIPNRWVVGSRWSFALAILFAYSLCFEMRDVSAFLFGILFYAPLPISLICSRIRFNRGERFTYA
jgi:hypothetical protein